MGLMTTRDYENYFSLFKLMDSLVKAPDLIIYLDNPIDVSLARMSNRSVKDTYENIEKLKIVKRNYDLVIQEYQGAVVKIPADLPVQDIHQRIIDSINNL